MKRVASLLAFVLLLGSANMKKNELLKCYSGYEGAIIIESGFNFCFMSIDFVGREVQYLGVEGFNHPFNNTKIDMKEGPCFLHYTTTNIYTYCYCRRSLCNTPQKPIRHNRYIARLLLEEKGKDLDY